MTLPQISLYVKNGRKLDNIDQAQLTVAVMMGSRAEDKSVKKYIKGLEES